MVCSHRCGAEEGTTTPLFPQAPEEIWNEPQHPPLILHLHSGKHPDWLHHCLVWKQQQLQPQSSAKGRANCPPHCRRWAALPPGHLHQAVHEESPEDQQWLQPPKPWTVLSAALRETYSAASDHAQDDLRDSFSLRLSGCWTLGTDTYTAHLSVHTIHHALLTPPPPHFFYQLDFNVACTAI